MMTSRLYLSISVFFYTDLFRMVTPAVPLYIDIYLFIYLATTVLEMKKFPVLKFLKNILDGLNHSDQGEGNILARYGSQVVMG